MLKAGRRDLPPSMPGGRGHLAALDLFRALAVLLVATAHFGRAFGGSAERACVDYGKLGVEVFFVISGFVIPYSLARSGYALRWAPLRAYAAKRFLRIHPPYVAAVALTLAIMLPWRHALGLPLGETWGSAARSLAYLHFPADNPVFWSLLVEVEYYALVALLFPLLAHRRLAVALGSVAVLLLAARLAGEPGGAFHLPQYLPRFAAGFALFWLGEGRIGRGGFLALLAALWFWDHGWQGSHEAAAALLAALAIAATMRRGWEPRGPFWKPLLFVGTISYSLFLIHLPVGGKVIVSLRHLAGGGASWGAGLLLFLAALAAALGAAWLFHRGIEAPCHRLAARVGKAG